MSNTINTNKKSPENARSLNIIGNVTTIKWLRALLESSLS